MKRKIILLWLCALIALLPLFAGTAEETAAETPPETEVWVMYVPAAANGSAQQATAKYAAKAIREWNGKTVHWYKAIASKENTEKDIFAGNAKFFAYGETQNGTDGTGKLQLQANNRPDAGKAVDFWVIVPAAAADNVANNSEWADFYGSLLAGNPYSALHLVFIGKGPEGLKKSLPGEIQPVFDTAAAETGNPGEGTGDITVQAIASPLEQLAETYPDRVSTTVIREQFTDTATDNYNIHTGDYLIASLAGNGSLPLDVDIAAEEGIRFTMPGTEARNVLVLARNAASLAVRDQITPIEGRAVTVEAPDGQADSYTGILFTATGGAEYMIENANPEDVKVYWYPDFSAVAPQLALGSRLWELEDHDISVLAADVLNRADGFSPVFTVLVNGNPVNTQNVARSEDGKTWTLRVGLTEETTVVSAEASLLLLMKDGNLAREWACPAQEMQITYKGVSLLENSLPEQVIYLYGNDATQVTVSAHELFSFKEMEHPAFTATGPEGETGITAGYDGSSYCFTVSVSDIDLARSHLDETFTVGFGGYGPDQEVTVRILDARKLLTDWINITYPEATEVKAGSTVPATVMIDPASKAAYDAAHADILQNSGIAFPAAEELAADLYLNGDRIIADRNMEPAEGGTGVMLEGIIPETAGNGSEQTVRAEIRYGSDVIKVVSTSVIVINTPPEEDNSLKGQETVSIDGIPLIQEYEETDLLQALGLDEPYSLFRDDETDIRTVTLTIEGTKGLTAEAIETEDAAEAEAIARAEAEARAREEAMEPEETDDGESAEAEDREAALELVDEPPAAKANIEGDTWTFVVTKDRPKVPFRILVKDPGEYSVTLAADDGANEPVVQTVRVKVVSKWLEIAKIAGIALAGLLVALIAFLVIRQVRKPKFDNVRIRCLLWSEENQEYAREVLSKSKPVSMAHFGKKPATLGTALVLTRQMPLPLEMAEIADDIILLPTKHDELSITFGKKAMAATGRQEKKEILPQGSPNPFRIRLGSQYLMIENV